VESFFGPNGALAACLATFEPRTEQVELAVAVAGALEAGEHLVAEAGTGTGKSLAYLVPALESGLRVVVSTATKALQEQLLTKDVPLAAAALGRELNVAVLKGRQNYVCRRALHGLELLGGQLLPRPDDAVAFDSLRPWLEETSTGDRAELSFEPSDSLWFELAVGADRCLGRRCPFHSVCFSEAARELASHADLVIVNHALYFADLAVRERADGVGVLPQHDAVVFDEAHRLEDVASTWLGGRFSNALLGRLARDLERTCREADAPFPARALDRAERAAAALFRQVCPQVGRVRLREPPLEHGLRLRDRLLELAEACSGRTEELDAIVGRAAGHAADVEACLEPDERGRVSWAEPDAVAWAPVDVSRALGERLWDAGPTAVLVSATLTVGGGFGFVRARLGLREAREVCVGSPFDFARQTLLYLPAGLPGPREPAALERVAEETGELCRVSGGRALVLTSSYRALEAIATGLRDRIPHELLVQGDAPRERLIERFRADVDSVLVATATFWQGVDVPGEALSLLVIDKLPFSPPDDPLVEARCERIAAEGGDWFSDYTLPAAVLQLRQGFGRLIRTREDRGVVAILDPRLRTKHYGRVFLDSLPDCPVTVDRNEVGGFFAAGEPVSA
jgi:ATP-dependent DNA helicase DinG